MIVPGIVRPASSGRHRPGRELSGTGIVRDGNCPGLGSSTRIALADAPRSRSSGRRIRRNDQQIGRPDLDVPCRRLANRTWGGCRRIVLVPSRAHRSAPADEVLLTRVHRRLQSATRFLDRVRHRGRGLWLAVRTHGDTPGTGMSKRRRARIAVATAVRDRRNWVAVGYRARLGAGITPPNYRSGHTASTESRIVDAPQRRCPRSATFCPGHG
jgi:hypothetical protein